MGRNTRAERRGVLLHSHCFLTIGGYPNLVVRNDKSCWSFLVMFSRSVALSDGSQNGYLPGPFFIAKSTCGWTTWEIRGTYSEASQLWFMMALMCHDVLHRRTVMCCNCFTLASLETSMSEISRNGRHEQFLPWRGIVQGWEKPHGPWDPVK